MKLAERVVLAREAYERALRAARREPTSRAWGRLVRAARNLKEALAVASAGNRAPA